MHQPVYDNDQVISALTTQDGTAPSLAWSVDIISFSIGTGQVDPIHAEYTDEMSGYVAMTPAMEAAARDAFALWDDLIAVDLLKLTDWPTAHITFNYSSNTGGSTYARYSSYQQYGPAEPSRSSPLSTSPEYPMLKNSNIRQKGGGSILDADYPR